MFVDYEQEQGLVAAAQAFPAVWWATIICADCAATYSALHEASTIPAEPWQPGVSNQDLRQPLQFTISGAFLRRLLGAEQRLGVAWGEAYSDLLLGEKEHEEYRIQLFLRRKQAGRLTMLVRSDPPVKGTTSLMIDHHVFYQQLDSTGSAVFDNLVETFFSTTSDLIFTLDILG